MTLKSKIYLESPATTPRYLKFIENEITEEKKILEILAFKAVIE